MVDHAKSTLPVVLEWLEKGSKKTTTLLGAEGVGQDDRALIGRDADQCDVAIDDPTNNVSRVHAEIVYRAQEKQHFLINCTRDRDQPNPILVNGKPVISEEVLLSEGMKIQFGKSVVMYIKYIARPDEQELPKYGLECPHCKRILSYKNLSTFCPWDGYSLAAARKVRI